MHSGARGGGRRSRPPPPRAPQPRPRPRPRPRRPTHPTRRPRCGDGVAPRVSRDAVRAEWLWASGRCAQTRNLRRHGARVVRVALHGGRAVTASLDGTVRIHDVKTGSEIRIRDEHDVGDGDGAASAEFRRTRPNGGGSSRGRVVRHPASFASHPASFTSPSARALPGGFGRRRRGGDERRFRHRVRRLARRGDNIARVSAARRWCPSRLAPVGSWRDSPTARRRREPSPTAASSREDASLDHHRPCVTSSGVWKFTRSRRRRAVAGASGGVETRARRRQRRQPLRLRLRRGGMPDRAPRGGVFPVDATLRGSRRTRAMRVFRVASSSRGWNLARRGGHRRRPTGRFARSTPSPVDASARWRAHREPPRRNTRVKCPSGGRIAPAGNHVRRRVGRTGGGGSRRRKRAGVDQRARRRLRRRRGRGRKRRKRRKRPRRRFRRREFRRGARGGGAGSSTLRRGRVPSSPLRPD